MIGVFDSRFGGLTVHKALTEELPELDFAYLGDSKNAPYGARPAIDILTLSCVAVDRLFSMGCRLVVIVCNTATAVALPWIQQTWLPVQSRADGIPRNVIGIVMPTVEAALADGAKSVAVLGTERTIQTEAYVRELQKKNPGVKIFQQPCPLLVRMIEDGAAPELIRANIHKYTGELYAQADHQWPDSVILGCTHYPLAHEDFTEALPGVTIVDQPKATAKALRAYLEKHPEYLSPQQSGQRRFLTTGDISDTSRAFIDKCWGAPVDFEKL